VLVDEGDRLEVLWHGEPVVDVPPGSLADDGPVYERPVSRPADLDGLRGSTPPPHPGVDELSEEDKILVSRARRIQRFLSQNTYVARNFTGVDGSTVSLADTVEAFAKICDGELDHVAEQAFFMCGGLDDVERKWSELQKNE